MPNRTAKLVSAIFASILAGAPFTTESHGAAGDCLSGPKGEAAEGRHWYYRIDRATQRHCWYLKDEEKASRAAPRDLSPSANSAPPKKETAAPRPVADARAELPPTRLEQRPGDAAAQPAAATATDAGAIPRTNPAAVTAQASVIASRWPGQSEASSPVSPQPATSPVSSVPSAPKAGPPAAVATLTLAAADAPSKGRFGLIPMLLTVAMGALSLAAVMGSTIFGFGRSDNQEIRGHRRVNWDYPGSAEPLRRSDIPRESRAADDPDRRIAEMLARLSRRAA